MVTFVLYLNIAPTETMLHGSYHGTTLNTVILVYWTPEGPGYIQKLLLRLRYVGHRTDSQKSQNWRDIGVNSESIAPS